MVGKSSKSARETVSLENAALGFAFDEVRVDIQHFQFDQCGTTQIKLPRRNWLTGCEVGSNIVLCQGVLLDLGLGYLRQKPRIEQISCPFFIGLITLRILFERERTRWYCGEYRERKYIANGFCLPRFL